MPGEPEHQEPRTAGHLRRVIAEKRVTWTVDARLRDTDMLPKYKRGGQETANQSNTTAPVADVNVPELLRQQPPTNPFLRARCVELNLLSHKDLGLAGTSPTTPTSIREDHDERG